MLDRWIRNLRGRRWANLLVVNLRILIGFALVPSGLKKVIDQPFTDPGNLGAFHEFLHAFHATGGFYQFVGTCQLVAAVLLMTQRFATVGALIVAPILTTILVFCWSTGAGVPTLTVVTLMFASTAALLLWDYHKWRGVLLPDHRDAELRVARLPPVIDMRLWQGCGLAILALFAAVSAVTGEIYRPRGLELDEPAFYVLPLIALFPVVTFVIDERRHRRRR